MVDINQQVVIEVDESGIRAAALGGRFMSRGLPPSKVEVTLDRPFAYLIRDRVAETVILSIGRNAVTLERTVKCGK
jgi:serine protease inhibitor